MPEYSDDFIRLQTDQERRIDDLKKYLSDNKAKQVGYRGGRPLYIVKLDNYWIGIEVFSNTFQYPTGFNSYPETKSKSFEKTAREFVSLLKQRAKNISGIYLHKDFI